MSVSLDDIHSSIGSVDYLNLDNAGLATRANPPPPENVRNFLFFVNLWIFGI